MLIYFGIDAFMLYNIVIIKGNKIYYGTSVVLDLYPPSPLP